METKICSKCGKDRPIKEFSYRNKEKETRRASCKSCQQKRDNHYYKTNVNRRKNIKVRKQNNRKVIRKYLQDLKKKTVCKCGEKRWYVMDIHHIKEELKTFDINNAGKKSLTKVKKELENCEVMCSNCHRELHHKKRSEAV